MADSIERRWGSVAQRPASAASTVFPAFAVVIVLLVSALLAAAPAHAGARTGGAHPDGSGLYGAWADPADQGRTTPHAAITWYLQTPVAPRGGLYGVIFYSNVESGQHFECSGLAVQEGTVGRAGFRLHATATRHAQLSCGDGAVAVRLAPVPTGLVARLVIPTTITSRQNGYGAHGVISMSGRSDIHLAAVPLVARGASTPPSTTGASTSGSSPPTPSSGSSAPTASSSSSAATIVVPTGSPVNAGRKPATDALGPVALTFLIVGVALAVLIIGAGFSLYRRRTH